MIADYPYSENILNMLFSLTKGILLIDIRRIDESDRNMQVFARGTSISTGGQVFGI